MRNLMLLGLWVIVFLSCANFCRAQNVYKTGRIKVHSVYTVDHIHGIDSSYFVLERCKVYDCGYVVEQVFSQTMKELMSGKGKDREMYFLIDSSYTEAQLLIVPHSQVCSTHTWSSGKKLVNMYFLRYKGE